MRSASAAVVVVPVKDVPQPSGQSVTLQASACARPVVLTRTRGLWDPDGLRDGDNVLLVPPGDARRARGGGSTAPRRPARRPMRSGRSARASVERSASVARYAERLLAIAETRARTSLSASTVRPVSLRTKPRAAVVHARSALRRVGARLATERDLRVGALGRAPTSRSSTRTRRRPSGGGHQFLRALSGELGRRGHRRGGEPHLGRHATRCLFNSFNFDHARLRRFARDDVRMVHRVDGPIGVYRGFDDGTDARIAATNAELADATVLQSRFSLDAHQRLGIGSSSRW